LAKANDRILFGASVHPHRPDWREELDFCLEKGAVLCKWIPSSQMINPADPNFNKFYKKLAEHDLPLLCHCGPELTIPTSCELYTEYNNPKYLEPALDLGVTVIIAHCAMPFYDEEEYQDDFDEFFRLFEKAEQKNWKLYADLSAVCFPFRKDEIEKVKQKLGGFAAKRLLYGSDYPIWVSAFSFNKSPNVFAWFKFLRKTFFIKNLLDKNFKVIKGMRFDDSILTNAARLFEKIKR